MLAIVPPATAFAHIDPGPTEAPAGSRQSVGFTVEHGCDGSPTIQLDMRLPDGVSAVTLEPPEGWEATVDGEVVTFVGGPLADDVELTFRVAMTLPATPDATIYFPFVQRCEAGEIRWIDVPSDGSAGELDEPAPAMLLTAALLTTTTASSATTLPAATIEPASTPPATVVTAVTQSTAEPTATTRATTPVAATADVVTTSPAAASTAVSAEGSGGTATVLVLGALLVMAIGGASIALIRRR